MDVGWPDLHAPLLDKVCTICKAMESWLDSDPQHVVVIHCRVSAVDEFYSFSKTLSFTLLILKNKKLDLFSVLATVWQMFC